MMVGNRIHFKAENSSRQSILRILEKPAISQNYTIIWVGKTDIKSLPKRIITEGMGEMRKIGKKNIVYIDRF